MVVDEPLPERVPLCGRDARVERGQLPQGDDLVAEGGARVLRRLGVAVHAAWNNNIFGLWA